MSVYEDAIGLTEQAPAADAYSEAIAPLETETSLTDKVVGGIDAFASTMLSTPAPIAGGLTGLTTLGLTGDEDAAVHVQREVEDAFTVEPKTETGQAYLDKLSEVLAPIAQFVNSVQQKTGDMSYDLGGDDAKVAAGLGAVAQSLPTAAGMMIPGVRPAMRKMRTPDQDVVSNVRKGNPKRAAQMVNPDTEVVQAAERLNIELEPGTVSQNKSFVELTQSLKSQPGNPLAVSELEAIEGLGTKARELVDSISGTDRTEFSDAVRADFDATIAELNRRTHQLHENLIEDRTVQVEVPSAEQYVIQALDEVGNKMSALSKPEKDLLGLIDDGNVTYGAIDRVRRNIGLAYQGRGPYRDTDDGILDQVYGAIAKDQMAKADELGVGDSLRLANQLVQERKGLEAKTLELFGRDLQRTLVSKITGTRAQISRGDLTGFRRLMETLPESRRAEGAALVVDALMGDNRGRFSLGNFAGVVETFKRNPSVKNEVLQHFTPEQRQVFDDLSSVTAAIQRTKSRENTSRTARDVLARLESPSFISKMFGLSKDIGRAESVGSVAGVPGAGTMGVLLTRKLGQKSTPAGDASDLLTSPRFRAALRQIERDEIDKANRIIEGSSEYRQWAKAHPAQASEIALIGFFGWVENQGE